MHNFEFLDTEQANWTGWFLFVSFRRTWAAPLRQKRTRTFSPVVKVLSSPPATFQASFA